MARADTTYRANRKPNKVRRPERTWVGTTTRAGRDTEAAAGMDTATAKAVLRGIGSGKCCRPFSPDLRQRASLALWMRPSVQRALVAQAAQALSR